MAIDGPTGTVVSGLIASEVGGLKATVSLEDYQAYLNGGKFSHAKTSITWSTSYSSVGYTSYDEPERVPESLCGNCRRDWHDIPLTETVASMWDSVTFSEDYDPEKDVSRVVCPGSDCCGPEAFPPGYYQDPTWSASPGWASIGYSQYVEHFAPIDPSSVAKMYADIVEMYKLLEWPNPLLPEVPESPWSFAAADAKLDIAEWFGEDPGITVSTWFPGDEEIYQNPEPVQNAASDAAPKAIEMAHKPPVPPGFDFSAYKDIPGYPPLKGKKKKK